MKYTLTALLGLIFTLTSFGQYVSVGEKPMSQGTFSSFTVTLEGQDVKDVEKEWKDFMKDYSGRTKRDRKSGEQTTTRATVSGLGGEVIIYAISQELGNDVVQTAWFESDGVMLDEGDIAASSAIDVMEAFILHIKKLRMNAAVEEQENALKNLEKDLQKAEKDEERNYGLIEKYKQELAQAEADLKQAQNDQVLKLKEIAYQHQVVDEIKSEAMNTEIDDDVEKIISDLKKRRENKMKNIEQEVRRAEKNAEKAVPDDEDDK